MGRLFLLKLVKPVIFSETQRFTFIFYRNAFITIGPCPSKYYLPYAGYERDEANL